MKTENFFSMMMQSESTLNKHEMNSIRGGSNTGGSGRIDEDILIPDPPDDNEDD